MRDVGARMTTKERPCTHTASPSPIIPANNPSVSLSTAKISARISSNIRIGCGPISLTGVVRLAWKTTFKLSTFHHRGEMTRR